MTSIDGLQVLHLVTAREVFFEQQIQALEKKGVDCTVCVVPGAEQIDGGLGKKRGIKEYLQYAPRVRRILRNETFDLIHANYGLTAPYAVTQFQLPVVLTLWGSDVVGFDGFVTKAFAWRANAVTVRSEEMRTLLGKKDVHIVPSGVDLERFRPIDQTVARERVGWDTDRTYVLFPYSPEYERKNYPLAKDVIKRVEAKCGIDISLQTVSGAPHNVMPYYINASDALLLTSSHEGSPNTVKEAMACNVPVVSTDVGDVDERLANVENSGVGTSANELASILTNVLRAENRSNGRDIVREVSWDQIGEQFVEIYHEVQQ